MRLPSLRQIEAFMAFIEAGTVRRAADALNISQPAASKLLSTLEDDSGLQLFERSGRRLALTQQGMRLYEEIERVFAGVHQIGRAIELIRREERGQLSVGIMPGFSGPLIRRTVKGFLGRYPDVHVSVLEHSSQFLADWLVQRQLDVGVLSVYMERDDLITEQFGIYPLVCVLPRGHRLAGRSVLTPLDLKDEPFVAIAPSPGRQLTDAAFQSYGITPHVVLDATTSRNVCEFVAAGMGVTVHHPLFVAPVRGEVELVRFEPTTPSGFLVARPRDGRNAILVDAFVEEAKKAASDSMAALALDL